MNNDLGNNDIIRCQNLNDNAMPNYDRLMCERDFPSGQYGAWNDIA
jgi:hypothetical protein